MTQDEYNEAAALVVRLREECTQAKDIAACLEQTNDDLTRALAANVDALVKSNAQCAEYLRQNEQLRADVAAAAEDLTRDISTLVDAGAAEYNKLHSELVEVRAALAATTEQRDSLRRTLDEWERADTKPHERVTADDVADHVVPPGLPMCLICHWCGSDLINCSQGTRHYDCPKTNCPATCTSHDDGHSPYAKPCTSANPVRHE